MFLRVSQWKGPDSLPAGRQACSGLCAANPDGRENCDRPRTNILMSLSLPFFHKKKDSQWYLGLFLKDKEAIGFALEKRTHKIDIITHERAIFTNGWDNLLEQVDELVFSLEQSTKKELNEVIFFIYSHLIDQQTKEIKKEYLSQFKNLVKNLELKPLGYIECYEAVARYLKDKEQSPLTAILIELGETHLGVFVYKGGQKTYTKILSRGDDIVADIESTFSEIKGDMLLPSRIILYDSYDLHAESTAIVSHRWGHDLFVQFPKVEMIKPQDLHSSLVTVFEQQINEEATVAQEGENQEEPAEETAQEQEVLGFVIGREVERREAAIQKDTHYISEGEPMPKKSRPLNFVPLTIMRIISSMKIIPSFLKLKGSIVLIMIGIVVILASGLAVEYFLHKVQVEVLFPSRTLSKELDIDMRSDGSDSYGIHLATISAELSEKKSTTGKRDIGEKAKGEVTISNFDEVERVLPKDTPLEVSGIKYTLDEEVKLSSGSSSIVGGNKVTTPGKKTAKLTAAEIGTEGNAAKGQTFKVGSFSTSSIFATNEQAFSGGSKKQIKTISKEDVDALKNSIIKKAKEDAQQKLSVESGDKRIIADLTETAFGKITVSKEVGEEASEVSLKASVITSYYEYTAADVSKVLRESFEEDVPDGFRLEQEKISFDIQNVKKKNRQITGKIDAKALVIKDVSKDQLIDKILGRKKSDLENLLKNDFQSSGIEIKSRSKIPLLFLDNWLPFFKKNIEVVISSL